MPYTIKNIKDIPKWLTCPLCGNYNTKTRIHFINHFNKCEEYEGAIEDIEEYAIDDITRISDFIEEILNCITTTRLLINTNELQPLENETPTNIRLYIKNKLLENITQYPRIELDAINIYDFFFGYSEESINEQCKQFMIWKDNQ